jgi:hypothetical protein
VSGRLNRRCGLNYPATVHCPTCNGWFCDAHTEDEHWHSCMLPPPGDVGGEAQEPSASAGFTARPFT